VHGSADEEVLNVVVSPAEPEKGVRRLQSVIRCLWELANYGCSELGVTRKGFCYAYLVRLNGDLKCREQYIYTMRRSNSRQMAGNDNVT
jgi:hypothetical protein